jgi:hypothetical protein
VNGSGLARPVIRWQVQLHHVGAGVAAHKAKAQFFGGLPLIGLGSQAAALAAGRAVLLGPGEAIPERALVGARLERSSAQQRGEPAEQGLGGRAVSDELAAAAGSVEVAIVDKVNIGSWYSYLAQVVATGAEFAINGESWVRT